MKRLAKQLLPALVAAFVLTACSESTSEVKPLFAAEDSVRLKESLPACVSVEELLRFTKHYVRGEYSAAYSQKPAEPYCATDADPKDRQRWTVLYVDGPLVAIAITKTQDYEQHLEINHGRHKRTYFTVQDWLEREARKD